MEPKNTFAIANSHGEMGAAVLATSRREAWKQARRASGMTTAQLKADGWSVRRVTDFGFEPAWSPDGRQIAFATE